MNSCQHLHKSSQDVILSSKSTVRPCQIGLGRLGSTKDLLFFSGSMLIHQRLIFQEDPILREWTAHPQGPKTSTGIVPNSTLKWQEMPIATQTNCIESYTVLCFDGQWLNPRVYLFCFKVFYKFTLATRTHTHTKTICVSSIMFYPLVLS
jgi:hypothetical protein